MTAHIFTPRQLLTVQKLVLPSKDEVIDRNKRENKTFLYTAVHWFLVQKKKNNHNLVLHECFLLSLSIKKTEYITLGQWFISKLNNKLFK